MPVRPKVFSSRLPDETVQALRHLGVDLNRSIEDLLKEGIKIKKRKIITTILIMYGAFFLSQVVIR